MVALGLICAVAAGAGCQRVSQAPPARTTIARVGTQTLALEERLLPIVSRAEVTLWVNDARMLQASGNTHGVANVTELETKRAMVRALLHQVVEPHEIANAEIEQYFEQHRDRYDFLETRLVSHFCARPTDPNNEDAWVAARRYAESALSQAMVAPDVVESLQTAASNVGDGRSFTGIFEQLSGFHRDGGLDNFTLDAAFTAAAFAIPPGTTTPTLARSSIGYHLLILREAVPEQRATFSEVAPQVERDMRLERAHEQLQALLQRLQSAQPTQPNEQEIAAFMQIELRTILGQSTSR